MSNVPLSLAFHPYASCHLTRSVCARRVRPARSERALALSFMLWRRALLVSARFPSMCMILASVACALRCWCLGMCHARSMARLLVRLACMLRACCWSVHNRCWLSKELKIVTSRAAGRAKIGPFAMGLVKVSLFVDAFRCGILTKLNIRNSFRVAKKIHVCVLKPLEII